MLNSLGQESAAPNRTLTAVRLLRNFLLQRSLANACAQKTAVILYAYLTARQKIRDGCHHFGAATRT
jgi:hypothetical protein